MCIVAERVHLAQYFAIICCRTAADIRPQWIDWPSRQ